MTQLWRNGAGPPAAARHLFPPMADEPLPRRLTQWRQDSDRDMGSTPYMRMSREGWNRGQLVLTSGPLTVAEHARHTTAVMAARGVQTNMRSQVSEVSLRLTLAHDMKRYERLYLPHSIDFRYVCNVRHRAPPHTLLVKPPAWCDSRHTQGPRIPHPPVPEPPG